MTLQPGAVLPGGRYRIEGEIGAGAFGVVYKAQDMQLERPVAIKELRRDALGVVIAARRRRAAQQEYCKGCGRALAPGEVCPDCGPDAGRFRKPRR